MVFFLLDEDEVKEKRKVTEKDRKTREIHL